MENWIWFLFKWFGISFQVQAFRSTVCLQLNIDFTHQPGLHLQKAWSSLPPFSYLLPQVHVHHSPRADGRTLFTSLLSSLFLSSLLSLPLPHPYLHCDQVSETLSADTLVMMLVSLQLGHTPIKPPHLFSCDTVWFFRLSLCHFSFHPPKSIKCEDQLFLCSYCIGSQRGQRSKRLLEIWHFSASCLQSGWLEPLLTHSTYSVHRCSLLNIITVQKEEFFTLN